ncbi:NlpC/P60 family protein [Crocosphaera sp.]|uniref:NlpC/P60 family protein n=1 Tax=Crocosphaera sp. TaxID=2729996 RepID=UPI002635E2D7|nr:NlpC/P60 family protein [Crocosphaera sp.]MDJ0579101.1 NlpC/P60 family protein [Crocosphaera sp.]
MLVNKFLKEADEWVGTPRMDGQCKKQVGCDCVGLLIGVAKEIGYLPGDYKEPNYYQTARGDSLVKILEKHLKLTDRTKDSFIVGDIVVIEYGNQLTHVGIIYSENLIIHSHRKMGVVKVNVDQALKRKIKKVFELWDKLPLLR